MTDKPQRSRSNSEVDRIYWFPSRMTQQVTSDPQPSAAWKYSLENPPPRTFVGAASVPAAEPGFYVVPRSLSAYDFYHGLFDNMPASALNKFSALNPGLESVVKAGSLIVLSDPKSTSCTFAEAQLMQAAQHVKAALDPLTPEEADFMHEHAAEIIGFTGQTSTWLGVSAAVLEKHLGKMAETLKGIEDLHQKSFRQHGHLKSAAFFAERKVLLAQLDAHLIKSTRLRSYTTMGDHLKLKSALGISSRSLVHHWKEAVATRQIPGYATHVNAVSRAAKYMKAGGYIGIGIGGVSSVLAVQEVCKGADGEACRKIRFTEGGIFAGSTAGGFAGGYGGYALTPFCAVLGLAGGVGGVLCAGVMVGTGSWFGATHGGTHGEQLGELLHEVSQP